jgi:uncharacterized protein (DUF362 family)
MAHFFKTSLTNGYCEAIHAGFTFLGDRARIGTSDRIAIKPNLTFPTFRRGVMTNPEAVSALIEYLKNYTDHISICESDSGGYNRFSMDEVFKVTGLLEIAKRYGVRVVNLSLAPSRRIRVDTNWRTMTVPIPTLLLDATDRFITLPVPKIHANTLISVAIKNQWGIIQIPAERLKLHPVFKYVIYAVNKSLPKPLVIVDGKFGLTRNGPMRGDVVTLNWLAMCDNLFANDVIVAQLMGFDPMSIPYIRYAMKKENIRTSDSHVYSYEAHPPHTEFYLTRDWTDYPGLMTFNSRALAYLGYESLLARSLHKLLYLFREPFY